MKIKTEKYASMLLREINDILYREIYDKDIIGTTATYINLADDLSFARVYCTVFDETKKEKALYDLNNAKGFIKGILGKRKLPLKKMPDLEFVYDDSLQYGEEMDKIIEETIKNDD